MSDDQFLARTMPSMDLVYSIARRCVFRREDAEDLVQETYVAAYRAWRDGRRPRRVEPWLATICLNLARSRVRSLARRPNEVSLETAAGFVAEAMQLANASDPEAEALAEIDRERIQAAMWRLPEGQRIAIALVDVADFSTAEAARIMGTPRGTVLSRLHRGRSALAAIVRSDITDLEEEGQ